MSDQTLLFWGMVVTIFILIAGMITARELIAMYFERDSEEPEKEPETGSGADSAHFSG